MSVPSETSPRALALGSCRRRRFGGRSGCLEAEGTRRQRGPDTVEEAWAAEQAGGAKRLRAASRRPVHPSANGT
jgi:hypothetical protein